MLDRVEFKRTPQQQLGLMIVGCVLVAGSWYLATTTPDGVCGTPFIFDRAGISFPGGTFPWSEIKNYSVVTITGIDEAVAFIREHSLVAERQRKEK